MMTRRALRPPPVEPLVRLNSGDYVEQRIQQNVEDATAKSRALPQAKGRKVTVSMPASGTVKVAHGLGRKPEGYNQQRASGASDPSFRQVSADSRNIVFESSAECTVDLWVF